MGGIALAKLAHLTVAATAAVVAENQHDEVSQLVISETIGRPERHAPASETVIDFAVPRAARSDSGGDRLGVEERAPESKGALGANRIDAMTNDARGVEELSAGGLVPAIDVGGRLDDFVCQRPSLAFTGTLAQVVAQREPAVLVRRTDGRITDRVARPSNAIRRRLLD